MPGTHRNYSRAQIKVTNERVIVRHTPYLDGQQRHQF